MDLAHAEASGASTAGGSGRVVQHAGSSAISAGLLRIHAVHEHSPGGRAWFGPLLSLNNALHMQRLVETAMLAAVGGVLYTLATVLKLQGYSAYVQPMPIVVAAMRWGPTAGRKTMTATCFLLLGKPIARHLH